MKAYLKLAALSLTLLCGACQPNDGWQQLFNGKDFTGFKQLNGKAPYRVENGCMVGQTVDKEPNSFMATEQTYGDFILEFGSEMSSRLGIPGCSFEAKVSRITTMDVCMAISARSTRPTVLGVVGFMMKRDVVGWLL